VTIFNVNLRNGSFYCKLRSFGLVDFSKGDWDLRCNVKSLCVAALTSYIPSSRHFLFLRAAVSNGSCSGCSGKIRLRQRMTCLLSECRPSFLPSFFSPQAVKFCFWVKSFHISMMPAANILASTYCNNLHSLRRLYFGPEKKVTRNWHRKHKLQ
jgi:hypothetical protein